MRLFRLQTFRTPLGNPWRYGLLLLITAGSLALVLSQQPIMQDPGYHQFADRRSFFNIANTLNVLSNIPFLAVGIYGLRICRDPQVKGQRPAWVIFFAAMTLVSIGSAWYHLSPDNISLVWDRLPMAIAFMCLLMAILNEHVSVRLASTLLAPAILLGLFSVVHWCLSNDLRLYAWVQFSPLVIIPLIMLLFRSRYTHRFFLLVAFTCYLSAKLAESFDRELLSLSQGVISGHSLKHLLAAACIYMLALMLRRREFADRP